MYFFISKWVIKCVVVVVVVVVVIDVVLGVTWWFLKLPDNLREN